MKKLKNRFRKALFAFFKEEIMEATISKIPQPVSFKESRFETAVIEQEIDVSLLENPHAYEIALKGAKLNLASYIEPFIHIDVHRLIDPQYIDRRKITLSLLVAKLKHD